MDKAQSIEFISNWLSQHQAQMRGLLEKLVNIDSFSHDPDGIRQVRQALDNILAQSGIQAEKIDAFNSHALLATTGTPSTNRIFLTGHMDTVFHTGTVAERPYREENDIAYGPGVADMKAGLVMNAFLMQAFHALSQHTPLSFELNMLATGDEEIGSPQGRHIIRQHLEGATAVFNAEPGRVSGNVVSARKGGGSYKIEVTGKAAHAGVNHADGISAIEALARIIQGLHRLTDYDAGITTNVGLVSGGTTPNTVAEYASATLDVRFLTNQQGETLSQTLKQCVEEHGVAGAQATISPIAGFLPFESEMSDKLLGIYRQQAHAIGLDVDGEFTGGCSDAGWTSSMGIPTLCGTGPVGGHAHTDREYCELNTFVERAIIVARSILHLHE